MTHPTAVKYAYAFEVRQINTEAVVGVGLIMPPEQHLSFLPKGTDTVAVREISDELWDEIGAWVTEGNENLPKQPAPMGGRIVAAILNENAPSGLVARRFAAIPVTELSHDPLMTGKVLPSLLRHRLAGTF